MEEVVASIAHSQGYVNSFKEACSRKYSNLCRAWRLLLDPGGVGRVSFAAFCVAARALGFSDVRGLWSAMDGNGSGFITLDEWDPVAFFALMEFRDICRARYGGLDTAFKLGMDSHGAARATPADLYNFCQSVGFTGDPQVLFRALDLEQRGFITAGELDFLSRWEGERFAHPSGGVGLGNIRPWLRRQRQLRIHRGSVDGGGPCTPSPSKVLPELPQRGRSAPEASPIRWWCPSVG